MSAENSSEANVRYVIAGTPVGWAAMAKTLRDVDGDKIRDCKEDIDTLLVFAGLFSAVLTAFLVESYKLLQVDNSAATVTLLRQIAAQTNTYHVSSDTITSTVTLPSSFLAPPPDFEPPTAAIRVNVLWFAALILSLVTASFGILVKQWLREYLAGEYTSGQARLRVRQFRYPGLADWHVFDIAAVLPLVVQLALGAFFLGLCFFTWSVHSSVGWTSTPLVVGWATMLVSSTIAPAFSPRCPFKMTLLKKAVKALRRLLWSIPPLGEALTTCQRRHYLPKPGSTFASETSNLTLGKRERQRLYEEEDAAKDERHDLAILASVDSILQDDDLLGTTMLESLQQGQFEPSEVVDFTLGALQRRLPFQYNVRIAATPPSSLLDLRQVRKQGWEAIVNILADTVAKGFTEPSRPSCYPPWMANCILIMLSFHNYPLTQQGNRALSLCLTGPEARECTAQVIAYRTRPTQPGNLAHVLKRLRPIFALLAPGDIVWGILTILHLSVCRDHQHSDDQLVEFFRVHDEKQLFGGVTQAVLGILVDCVNREATGDESSWSQWTGHALRALLSCDVPSDVRRDVSRLICTLSRRTNESYATLLNVTALDKKDRAFEKCALSIFKNMFADAEIAERRSILNNIASINNQYIRDCPLSSQQDTGVVPINPIRLCRLGAYLMQGQNNAEELQEEWQNVWTSAATAIRQFLSGKFDVVEQRLLAEECLPLLEALDLKSYGYRYGGPESISYEAWLESFDPKGSRFPEALFEQLDILVPGRFGLDYKRIRRLRENRERRNNIDSQIPGKCP